MTKANAICGTYHARATKLPLPHTVSGYEDYARRTLPLYREALAALTALRPAKADEPLVARWLARDRAIENDIVRIARLAHQRRLPELTAAVGRAGSDNTVSARLARRLGLDVCARA